MGKEYELVIHRISATNASKQLLNLMNNQRHKKENSVRCPLISVKLAKVLKRLIISIKELQCGYTFKHFKVAEPFWRTLWWYFPKLILCILCD